MAQEVVPAERTIRNYTHREYVLRMLWGFVYVFFRYSPRLLYGWRNFILRIMGASIGRGVKIYPSAKIMFPWNLTIEDGAVISWGVNLYNLGKIEIGKNTIISQFAHICAGNHDYTTKEFKLLKSPVVIKDNVWIAADAFVGPGLTIENNVVVYARAVVVNNIGEGKVVGGNPARVLKDR